MGGCHRVKALMTSDGSGHSRLNEVGASFALLDDEDAMGVFCVGGGRFLDACSGVGLLGRLS